MNAGTAIDKLAEEYSGRALFVEYAVDSPPAVRYDYWWDAFGGGQASLPMVMVDSGNQIKNGSMNYYSAYQNMIDAALSRPPQAEVEAYWWRAGDKIQVAARVKNLGTAKLSDNNRATLHAIVTENARVAITNRFGRSVTQTAISSLASGATKTFHLETSDLSGLDWNNLSVIVLADYSPSGMTGAHDMLQAALASFVAVPLVAQPGEVTFLVDPAYPSHPSLLVTLQGVPILGWTASETLSWLDVTPLSGPMGAQATLTVVSGQLAPGWQQGQVTFVTSDGLYSQPVTVNAYYGTLERLYLPLVAR